MVDPKRWNEGGFHVLRGLASAQDQLELVRLGSQIIEAAPLFSPLPPGIRWAFLLRSAFS